MPKIELDPQILADPQNDHPDRPPTKLVLDIRILQPLVQIEPQPFGISRIRIDRNRVLDQPPNPLFLLLQALPLCRHPARLRHGTFPLPRLRIRRQPSLQRHGLPHRPRDAREHQPEIRPRPIRPRTIYQSGIRQRIPRRVPRKRLPPHIPRQFHPDLSQFRQHPQMPPGPLRRIAHDIGPSRRGGKA